tara:strand:+ start:479 stop:706 length:228 start_codon:yes stop_codon:yes gene_type:complete
MTKYSFTLEKPKRFKNRKIFVEANSAKEAKELILQELHKINKRFVKVYELIEENDEDLQKIADSFLQKGKNHDIH